MDIGKWKILAVSFALICCLAVPVLAYTYLWRTPLYQFSAGIILLGPTAPTMQLGFYWNPACTLPVTTIDLGEIAYSTSPTEAFKEIWIRNEGSNETKIFWNSTLSAATTAITEIWIVLPGADDLNSTVMLPDDLLATCYQCFIQASPPVGTYNWTLTVWGETYV
jgi:hypothetical protein